MVRLHELAAPLTASELVAQLVERFERPTTVGAVEQSRAELRALQPKVAEFEQANEQLAGELERAGLAIVGHLGFEHADTLAQAPLDVWLDRYFASRLELEREQAEHHRTHHATEQALRARVTELENTLAALQSERQAALG